VGLPVDGDGLDSDLRCGAGPVLADGRTVGERSVTAATTNASRRRPVLHRISVFCRRRPGRFADGGVVVADAVGPGAVPELWSRVGPLGDDETGPGRWRWRKCEERRHGTESLRYSHRRRTSGTVIRTHGVALLNEFHGTFFRGVLVGGRDVSGDDGRRGGDSEFVARPPANQLEVSTDSGNPLVDVGLEPADDPPISESGAYPVPTLVSFAGGAVTGSNSSSSHSVRHNYQIRI
jgi:hypothetical protein